MQIARGAHLQIDGRMARKAFEHMVEKADSGVDVVDTRPVEIDGRENLRLPCLAFNGGGAHGRASSRSSS
jgi:hypothetical protein